MSSNVNLEFMQLIPTDSQSTTRREGAHDLRDAGACATFHSAGRNRFSSEGHAPRVKHMHAPRIQHHVTDAGPPRRSGVLNVVAIDEQRPMILNAKLI